jgi:hypothetical protein
MVPECGNQAIYVQPLEHFSNWNKSISISWLSGVMVGGHRKLKTTVKTKAVKTWYKMDLM